MKSFQWNANDVLLNGYLRIKWILEGDWNKMEWLWILARNRFLRPPVISGCSNRNAKRALKWIIYFKSSSKVSFTFRPTLFNTTDDNIWQPIIFVLQIFFIKFFWYFIFHFFSLYKITKYWWGLDQTVLVQWSLPFLKLKCSNSIFEHLIFGQKWCFIRIDTHFQRHVKTYTGCKPTKKHLSVVRDKLTAIRPISRTLIHFLLIPDYRRLS